MTFDYPETDEACLDALASIKAMLHPYDVFVSTTLGDASAEPIEDIGIKSRVVDEDAGFEIFVSDSDSDGIDVDAIKADSIHKFKKSLNLDDILDDGSEDEMSSNVENSAEDNN